MTFLSYSPQLAGLAANPALPEWLLERFVAAAGEDLRADLACRSDLRQDLWDDLNPALEVVRHPLPPEWDRNTPPGVLFALSAAHDDEVDLGLAGNPATPPAILADLMERPASWWNLVSRSDLPQSAYVRLAADSRPAICWNVVTNPAMSESSLREVAVGADRDLRRHLVRNPSIPLDLLVDLAPKTRIGPETPPRIRCATVEELRQLAASPVMQVRMLVAERRHLPADLVELLLADRDRGVAKGIVTDPAVTAEQVWALVARHGPHLYPRAARNPNCTPALLHHLVVNATGVEKVYRAVARHPRAAGSTLSLCLADREARRDAARHPNLPVETIIELLAAESAVAESAASNPSLPVAVMAELIGV